MSKDTLKLVLTDHWFEEIKSGRKTHEYRKATPFWLSRILRIPQKFTESLTPKISILYAGTPNYVEFQKAYRKNPERMKFRLLSVMTVDGKNTDLKCDGVVFDIELGERVWVK